MMRNTLILMQSRTGSSAIAGVFRAHGWNTGADRVTSRWYFTHENQEAKKILVGKHGSALEEPLNTGRYRRDMPHVEADADLSKCMNNVGAPWAWKGDAYYLDAWLATFEDLAIVYVIREVEEAIQSSLAPRRFSTDASRSMAEGRLRAHLHKKYEYMRAVQAEHGGIEVDASAVLSGDFKTLQAAIEYAGSAYSEPLTKATVIMDRPRRTT